MDPEAAGPSASDASGPSLDVPALDTVRMDAWVFLDVGRTADLRVFLDVPQVAPDSSAPPSDARRACNAPPNPPRYATVECDSVVVVGTVATYKCQDGYRPTTDGSATTTKTCRADGTWEGPTIECSLANCGPPPTVENAYPPEYTTTTAGSTAKYSCKDNFNLSGSVTLTCGNNGAWSFPPACNPIRHPLTVNVVGSTASKENTVTGPDDMSCTATCDTAIQAGTEITLTANPGQGWGFIGWSGSQCSGVEKTCVFTISGETRVNAKFSPPPNIMFVTSTKQSADLNGLLGADALCNQRAKAVSPPLRGTYKAWLSTATASAASRMGPASGWVRPDGLPVFNRVEDLMFSKMFYPPRLDETGVDLGHVKVMTGTTSGGTHMEAVTSTTCGDYTSTSNPTDTFVLGGYASASNAAFTDSLTQSCQDEQRIYCMGVDYTATLTPPKAVQGRYAFTTKDTWLPGGGIASADAKCQSEATAAALPGTYKALLATDGGSAASRFTTPSGSLPWIRTDRIRVTGTAAAFFTTALFDLVPNLSADGTMYVGGYTAWSGAATMTAAGTPATTCLNWMSGEFSATGRAGELGVTGTAGFFGGFETACNTYRFLVCLQE